MASRRGQGVRYWMHNATRLGPAPGARCRPQMGSLRGVVDSGHPPQQRSDCSRRGGGLRGCELLASVECGGVATDFAWGLGDAGGEFWLQVRNLQQLEATAEKPNVKSYSTTRHAIACRTQDGAPV